MYRHLEKIIIITLVHVATYFAFLLGSGDHANNNSRRVLEQSCLRVYQAEAEHCSGGRGVRYSSHLTPAGS
jgi:hypothetical protein